MKNNEEYPDSRHTFGHEDIEEFEEKDEAQWPRPGRDLRAHLYKYILGLTVLVLLVLGSVLYLLNPFGGNEDGITTERFDPVQTVPRDRTPLTDTAISDETDEPGTEALRDVSGEPSSKYISMQDEEEPRRTVPGDEEAEGMARLAAPTESETTEKRTMESSEAGALPSSTTTETGSETRMRQEAAPPADLSSSPVSSSAAEPRDRKKPATDSKTRSQAKIPEKKAAPETRVSKAEPSPRSDAAKMPFWYVQVGAFEGQSNATDLKARLEKAGFPTHVAPARRGNRTLYLTRVGPYPSRVKAEIGAEKLRKDGHPATILKLKQ